MGLSLFRLECNSKFLCWFTLSHSLPFISTKTFQKLLNYFQWPWNSFLNNALLLFWQSNYNFRRTHFHSAIRRSCHVISHQSFVIRSGHYWTLFFISSVKRIKNLTGIFNAIYDDINSHWIQKCHFRTSSDSWLQKL